MPLCLNSHAPSTSSLSSAVQKKQTPEKVDPCDDYQPGQCPSIVADFGQKSSRDILPLQTLLRAAGLGPLESTILTPPLPPLSMRYSGVVLLVSIIYSNLFVDTGSWREGTYTVTMGEGTYTVTSGEDA
jgi:hypothetical protein